MWYSVDSTDQGDHVRGEALTAADREEISRGITEGLSGAAIASSTFANFMVTIDLDFGCVTAMVIQPA